MTSAFGFRNLANYDRGLAEIYRVLAPDGEVGILDFGEPKGLIGKLYRVYFRRVLPAIGTMISGVRGPYAYLPASVLRFPSPDEMLQRMRVAGFREVVLDSVHVWDCGTVSGKEVGARDWGLGVSCLDNLTGNRNTYVLCRARGTRSAPQRHHH